MDAGLRRRTPRPHRAPPRAVATPATPQGSGLIAFWALTQHASSPLKGHPHGPLQPREARHRRNSSSLRAAQNPSTWRPALDARGSRASRRWATTAKANKIFGYLKSSSGSPRPGVRLCAIARIPRVRSERRPGSVRSGAARLRSNGWSRVAVGGCRRRPGESIGVVIDEEFGFDPSACRERAARGRQDGAPADHSICASLPEAATGHRADRDNGVGPRPVRWLVRKSPRRSPGPSRWRRCRRLETPASDAHCFIVREQSLPTVARRPPGRAGHEDGWLRRLLARRGGLARAEVAQPAWTERTDGQGERQHTSDGVYSDRGGDRPADESGNSRATVSNNAACLRDHGAAMGHPASSLKRDGGIGAPRGPVDEYLGARGHPAVDDGRNRCNPRERDVRRRDHRAPAAPGHAVPALVAVAGSRGRHGAGGVLSVWSRCAGRRPSAGWVVALYVAVLFAHRTGPWPSASRTVRTGVARARPAAAGQG